jgi:hypothetical protein
MREENRIEHFEEQRSPFPREWGQPPLDLQERMEWAKQHAARAPLVAIERRKLDPALALAHLKRRLELMKRGPV